VGASVARWTGFCGFRAWAQLSSIGLTLGGGRSSAQKNSRKTTTRGTEEKLVSRWSGERMSRIRTKGGARRGLGYLAGSEQTGWRHTSVQDGLPQASSAKGCWGQRRFDLVPTKKKTQKKKKQPPQKKTKNKKKKNKQNKKKKKKKHQLDPHIRGA